MNYNAAYEMVMDLQQQLRTEILTESANELQYAEHLRHLDYRTVKALAATYELQEYLADKVEDELLDEAMKALATEEGQRLLEENERLKNDPNFTVPEETHKRMMDLIMGG